MLNLNEMLKNELLLENCKNVQNRKLGGRNNLRLIISLTNRTRKGRPASERRGTSLPGKATQRSCNTREDCRSPITKIPAHSGSVFASRDAYVNERLVLLY